ncbi:hypothetical protein RF11_07410 [Thelohanellus kitauei]|uniref:TFIIS N-terminal domain-containing protein n=1 Tax=Thelohanellus kitauei TaxID=669202 RepID=A0A0C2JJG0_THEKT|nr:hypothetical protein RF11_07410 [Thelohanellus kitauei]
MGGCFLNMYNTRMCVGLMNVDDLHDIREKIDSFGSLDCFDEGDVVDKLKKLSNVQISKEVLRETKIGISVNNLLKSKSSSDIVKTECKAILKRWRSEIRRSSTDEVENKESSSNNDVPVSRSVDNVDLSITEITEIDDVDTSLDEVSRPRKRTLSTIYSETEILDPVREGFKNIILKALNTSGETIHVNVVKLALEIEEGSTFTTYIQLNPYVTLILHHERNSIFDIIIKNYYLFNVEIN